MKNFLDAVILGVVEGLTEFIPVSSTGHLIVVGNLLNFKGSLADSFEVFIQLGAICAVLVIYRKIFFSLFQFDKKESFSGRKGMALLMLTTIPALILGAAAHGAIKKYLFNPQTVSIGLGLGGIALLAVERYLPQSKKLGLDALTYRDAILIGFFQCLSLWPGMSRSACTILGAMLLQVERKTAVEYSFLAAVPVMFAATFYDLYKSYSLFSSEFLLIFAVGFIVSFVSAWISLKFFLRLISFHTLIPFGWYRIFIAPLIQIFH
ncbi:MAG: undecaprenyl-diphosphate phosphatase [Elusimicrobia bacterium]|nr:undecaprenyl-diphosphate phosphatase [Elusimicrobiota bacterium]